MQSNKLGQFSGKNELEELAYQEVEEKINQIAVEFAVKKLSLNTTQSLNTI